MKINNNLFKQIVESAEQGNSDAMIEGPKKKLSRSI